jgi:hypothetical protein
MLIDITRILGITNRYLAAGGVKGDSHFPWHSLSNLSKIRRDLDIWASGTDGVFSSLDALFGQPDSTVLVLSKLIYHLIHCLVYRPFLPIDLAELAGTGQHQSWQIQATNMCFLHANAITELVELGKQTAAIEWPAFVGYCICTAGTVHVHGAHYSNSGGGAAAGGEMSVFASSADLLSREMQQLSELRGAWASVQHQRETLQGIYGAHSELVKSLANSAMRYSPVFHLEDFFDRYSNIGGPGGPSFHFDAANLSLTDVVVDDSTTEAYSGHGLYALPQPGMGIPQEDDDQRQTLKRKIGALPARKRPAELNHAPPLAGNFNQVPHPTGLPTPSFSHPQRTPVMAGQQSSPTFLQSPTSLAAPHRDLSGLDSQLQHPGGFNEMADTANVTTGMGFGLSAAMPGGGGPFSPPFSYPTPGVQGGQGGENGGMAGYDPMFGTLPTDAFSSPAAWQGDEVNDGRKFAAAPNPGTGNNPMDGGAEEEKDPFLSLLEQLAEGGHQADLAGRGSGANFDFFFGGNGAAA